MRGARRVPGRPTGRSRLWATLGLALVAASGCGDATGPQGQGLAPGTYAMKFEVSGAIGTPEELQGRHDFTFRVRAPGASAEDVDLVSSRRIPPDGVAQHDYLVLDRSVLVIEPGRWQIRFPYAEGDFAVSVTLRATEGGSIVTLSGCFGRSGQTASFQGSGCRLDHL